jgi:hypothetical protein
VAKNPRNQISQVLDKAADFYHGTIEQSPVAESGTRARK